ncbi:MAG: hypothetical protein M3Z01_09600 [Thermoproteota archaeon]|nr:hypothetical protein [Thermoproteota archaeon]
MLDGLGQGKPFLASDNGFFREFSKLGSGIIATKRNATCFEEGLQKFDNCYDKLKSNIDEFRRKLR